MSQPVVSFNVEDPSGPPAVAPDQGPGGVPTPVPSPRSSRRLPTVDSKTGDDRSGAHGPPSIPSSAATQRLDRRSNSRSVSRNSSAHSLLLLGFENSESSRSGMDERERNFLRCKSVKHMKAMTKKKQEINQVQRLLLHQQKLYITLYSQIKELEAKTGIDSGENSKEIRLLTMEGWPPHDLLLLVLEAPAEEADKHTDIEGVLGPAILGQIASVLSPIPKEVLDMGLDLAARRNKVLETLRKRIPELKVSKNEYDADTDNINKLVFDMVKKLEANINRGLQFAKISWKDREALIHKIESLNKELSIARSKIKPIEEKPKTEVSPNNDLNNKKIESRSATDLKERLMKERAARESMKHTVATAEGMLRTARARITVLERDLKQAQKQLEASARKHKEFELLHRCRETSYDVRSKKLLQVSKTGEVTIEMLSLQRDALELRVKELQDQIKSVIEDYEARQTNHQACLERLQEKLEDQERHRKTLEARGMELEKRIKDLQEEYKALLGQSERLVKMSSERCLDFLPRKENDPSQRETELWKELQFTKRKLARVSEELRQSREDREGLLNSLAKIAQEGSENNMATELLLREQKNFDLQQINEKLKENVKSLKENLAQKDEQLNSLRSEVSRKNYQTCTKDSPKEECALEVIDLTAQVASLTRERESLVSEAMSRALMLERHERCAELFAQVTRARRDIAAQLAGRPERPSSEGAFPDHNLMSSISSSCLKAAETWAELRTDRERVLQLQEVVASQNLQLKRECRIRNQLEQRRAILERLFLNRAGSNQYMPAENVATYLGTSSYFVKDTFLDE